MFFCLCLFFVLVSTIQASPAIYSIRFGADPKSTHCLYADSNQYSSAQKIEIYDCGTKLQGWVMNHGSTKVQLPGSNKCLHSPDINNGTHLTLAECSDATQWNYHTLDNRLMIEGTGACMDLVDGNTTNCHEVQVWQCVNHNTNQIWTLRVEAPLP